MLEPFLDVADAAGYFRFQVGTESFAEFYYRVMPELLENPFVIFEDHCGDLAQDYLPPEPRFVFLLDLTEDTLSLRAKVFYEDAEYDLGREAQSLAQPASATDKAAGGYRDEDFEKTFERPIAKLHDPHATEKLKAITAPFILRRKKAEVLKDLPDKLEEVQYARLEGKQQKLYDAQVLRIKGMLGASDKAGQAEQEKMKIFSELTRIRQICCDPSLCFEDYDDPWWNLAAQNQATDRAHRIGQQKQVTVYKLILKDTIEERILKLQDAKRDLAEAILEGERESLFTLSPEDLLQLLG